MNTGSGTYFDGKVARGHRVTLEFVEPGLLRFSGEGIAQEHELARVRVSDRLGDVPRFLYLPGDALIETPNNDLVDAALAARRRSRGAQLIHALESHRRIAAVACVLLVAAIGAIGYWAPPLLARVVAQRVPPDIDQRIGAATLASMRRYTAPTTLTAAEQQRVRAQLARLQADPAVPRPRLEFYAMAWPNAFALPGNVIIVTDQLVRLPASDDELAAVLAHELGHLERRHGLQGILRESFALLVVAAITGDLSSLTSFASTVPLTLLTAGYSRDLEREADRYALELLRRRGIKPQAFSTVLLKMENARDARVRHSHYLSTHPATDERTAIFGGLTQAERNAVLAAPWLEKAATASRRGDHTSTIECCTRFLELSPTAGGYVLRAKSHLAKNNRAAADADLAEALKMDPQSAEALALHAEALALHQQKFAEAVVAARAALALAPDNPDLLAILGYAETMTGEKSAAAAHFERALALSRTNFHAWAYRGYLKQTNDDHAGAIQDYDIALKLRPNTEWVLYYRGAARVRSGDYGRGLTDLAEVHEPSLLNADYYYHRGHARHALGQHESAIADYTLCLEKGGGRTPATFIRTNRGNAYLATGDIKAALADLEKAIEVDPKNGRAYLPRAVIRSRMGNRDGALADLERARAAGVDEWTVLCQRGNILREAGQHEAALRDLDQALAEKSDAHPRRARGLTHFALGNFARAEIDFAECLKLVRTNSEEYAEFFLLLARRRQKHNEQRRTLAAHVAAWPAGWPKSIGRFLVEEISETQLLAAANLGEKPTREERLCEAYFYIAEKYLHDGNRAMAESFYEQCVDMHITRFAEHQFARAELARLRQKP